MSGYVYSFKFIYLKFFQNAYQNNDKWSTSPMFETYIFIKSQLETFNFEIENLMYLINVKDFIKHINLSRIVFALNIAFEM